MAIDGYRYAFEFYSEAWERLGRQEVEIDLEPAREFARFELLRRGTGLHRSRDERCVVVPRWNATLGPPYVRGLRVSLWQDYERVDVELPGAYFQLAAREAAARGARDRTLPTNGTLRFLVLARSTVDGAWPGATRTAPPEGGPGRRWRVRRESAPVCLVRASLAWAQRRAAAAGEIDERDLPVFLDEGLLREVEHLARAAGGAECGGLLVGRLCRDRAGSTLFLEVTGQIPAEGAEAGPRQLTFSPEIWRELDAAVERRGGREMRVGWWHSHPVGHWGEEAPQADQEAAAAPERVGEGFLSDQDLLLHRTVFPAVWCVALVVTDPVVSPPTCTLFGWRCGVIVRRGFHLWPARGPAPSGGRRCGAGATQRLGR